MSLLVALVVATVLCAQVSALPSGFSKQYVGTINNVDNLMDMEFLPNGYTLLVGRQGKVLIADLYSNNIPKQTYLDLSSVIFSNGMSAAIMPAGV